MPPRLLRLIALFVVPSLFWTGCGETPPFEALFDDSPEALGTGITGVGLVRAVVIIAKYQATKRQREVAEQRARRAYARLKAEASAETPSRRPSAPAKKKTTTAKAPSKTTPEKPATEKKTSGAPTRKKTPEAPSRTAETAPETERPAERETAPEPAPKPKPRKKIPRYIAVDTEPDERSQGAKSVMLWDTYSQQIVGNNVYDIEVAPQMLKTAKFETFAAQYVGTGSF